MNQSKKINNKKGQAMLIAVVIFMLISLAVVIGVATPVSSELHKANNLVISKESYALSEGGLEDVNYRVRNAMTVDNNETVFLGLKSTSVSITDISAGKKEIKSTASLANLTRSSFLQLTIGVGTSFNYGVQSGTGGFEIGNATVDGNVYSNGNIIGVNGATITGTAIAANSAALNADQTNGAFSDPPTNSIIFGKTSPTEDLAQSFQLSSSGQLNKIDLYLKKEGSPPNATVKIVTDSSGSPSTNVLTSGTLNASLVSSSFNTITITFSPNVNLSSGVTYWFVIDAGTNDKKYYISGATSDTSYINGTAKTGKYGGSWSSTSLDSHFKIYLDGLTATIIDVDIGTNSVGDAHAHTVTDSTIQGQLRCQVGTGNNKACVTSFPDPSPKAFPISDGNINQWKSEAEAGGITNGNVTISVDGTSLGPRKIVGNLIINEDLTITGTIWVTGTITTANSVIVSLHPSYGENGGVIVTDNRIDLSNLVQFNGTGQTGSYVLLITTSGCPADPSCGGNPAINISNNSGTVILNAQRGTIVFAPGSEAKEATANKIILSNNATIIYESGLADINFTSGPAGGYEISSWREVE